MRITDGQGVIGLVCPDTAFFSDSDIEHHLGLGKSVPVNPIHWDHREIGTVFNSLLGDILWSIIGIGIVVTIASPILNPHLKRKDQITSVMSRR